MVDEDASLVLSQMQRETLDKPIEAMPGMETSEVERDDWARLFTGKLNEEGSFPRTLRDLTRALAEIARFTAQLPEGMKDCTIVFKECEKGHGRLTATNWIDHGCPTCERDRLTAALVHKEEIATTAHDEAVRLTAALAEAEQKIEDLQVMMHTEEDNALAREARAREEEREACAKIGDADPFLTGHGMAIRIRARTTP